MPGRAYLRYSYLIPDFISHAGRNHWHLCDEKPRDLVPGRFGDIADSI